MWKDDNDDILNRGSYSFASLAEHCSDPMTVSQQRPGACCQQGAGSSQMCVWMQRQADTPRIQVRLSGIEIRSTKFGSAPRFSIHCYTTRGSSTGKYLDMSFVLAREMFDKWDDDELISDMPSLLDVSPTYVGTTVTCEVVKGEGAVRGVAMVQHFDFGYIMRNCHESEKPEFGERSDMWADKYHKRKLLADEYRSGRGRQGRGLLGGDEDEEEKEVYTFKKTSAGTAGAKKCCYDKPGQGAHYTSYSFSLSSA
jgi:hypothetical protein